MVSTITSLSFSCEACPWCIAPLAPPWWTSQDAWRTRCCPWKTLSDLPILKLAPYHHSSCGRTKSSWRLGQFWEWHRGNGSSITCTWLASACTRWAYYWSTSYSPHSFSKNLLAGGGGTSRGAAASFRYHQTRDRRCACCIEYYHCLSASASTLCT